MTEQQMLIGITNKLKEIVKALKRGHDVEIKTSSSGIVVNEVRKNKI